MISKDKGAYCLYDGDTLVCQFNADGTLNAAMTVGANGLLSQRTLAASLFYTYDLGGDVAQRWSTAGYNDYAFDAYGRRAVTLSGDYYTRSRASGALIERNAGQPEGETPRMH